MTQLRFRLRVFLSVLLLLLVGGSLGFVHLEGLSALDAIYFSIVTVATVGFGDIHPVTPAGKLLTIFMIISGVGTFLGVIANATEIFLNRREELIRRQKLHTVLGLFMSEMGNWVLQHFAAMDPASDRLHQILQVKGSWKEETYATARAHLQSHPFSIVAAAKPLEELRRMLLAKGRDLLRLLENPVLLENETFTELLRALFHLREELLHRTELDQLPESDLAHLAGDMRRVYSSMVLQWLDYVQHLQHHYPYLFSLAVRINPFDPAASPVLR